MARANVDIHAFNRGIVSPLALARRDLDRIPLSAELQKNFIPRALGSMMIRPGLQYIGATDSNNTAFNIPFVYASDDTALIELTATTLRIWDDDALITRASVSTAVTNGAFTSNVTGWTDQDGSGSTSAWKTGGYLSLIGNTTTSAKREQEVTVGGGDANTEHALDIDIERGPVTLRVGSTSGDDDYINEIVLGEGFHSLTFTPTGNFFIQFLSYELYETLVDSVAVGSSGVMSITAPWAEADLSKLRYGQSGDVLFIACEGYQQRTLTRHSATGWQLELYQPTDGPFRTIDTSGRTITSNATTGDVTLTASAALFNANHVGALFKAISDGQSQAASVTAENNFTSSVKVTTTGNARNISIILTGTWTATVTLQYSTDDSTWVDLSTWTANTSENYLDGLDDQIIYYRVGVKTGGFTSGTVVITLTHTSGTQTGIARVTAVASDTSASASVLQAFGDTNASDDWHEGSWSTHRGFPTCVSFFEGRLWWAGRDKIFGSVSDAFWSFDDDTIGDSGPIQRSIGFGPVDVINWMLPMQRLMMGTQGGELSSRSSSFDEPLTPTNFNLKPDSTQGSHKVQAVKVDDRLLFVQRSKIRVYEMDYSSDKNGYSPLEVTIHAPEVGEPEIVRLVEQRQPDTRIHAVRSDGKVALLLYDPGEDVLAWCLVETDGDIEDVVVVPGTTEDQVYYVVKRTIDSATKRYLEKWSLENDVIGGTEIYSGASTTSITDLDYPTGITVTVRDAAGTKIENLTVTNGAITLSTAATYADIRPAVHKLADSFLIYSGASTTSITGLSHLEGETVVVRGDGKDLGTYTVSSGAITLSEAVEKAVIGLSYTAKWKGSKLSHGIGLGTALGQRKTIQQLGLIMNDVDAQGITYGPDFNNLDNLPAVIEGATVADDHIFRDYDFDMMAFLNRYTVDARLCLQAAAPNPVTLLALVAATDVHHKS